MKKGSTNTARCQSSKPVVSSALRVRHLRVVAALVVTITTPSVLFSHGGFDERIARLLVSLESQPANPALRIELADVRIQHADWADALIDLNHVDRLAPGKYATDLMRGEAYLLGKMPAPAKQALDRFIAAHPGRARAFTLRARAHEALGAPAACLADYRSAWAATDHPEPDFVHEFATALAAHDRHEESLGILRTGMEKLGAIPALVLLALDRECATGRFDAALARIDILQKSAPRPEPWMAKRAALLGQAGRTAEARNAWQAFIDHLAALPNLERGSHAMSIFAEQARRELAALPPGPAATAPQSFSAR